MSLLAEPRAAVRRFALRSARLAAVPSAQPVALRIAILGNPNAGKSTLFNQLTGLRQKVANYPGVTVEKKTGVCPLASGRRAEILDLPGTYSLHPGSPDEVIVRDVLLGLHADTPPPDLLLVVVDATHLDRHLYLALQAIELGRPMILALNMSDVAEARGIRIDEAALSRRLGVPVIAISASKGTGLGRLRRMLDRDVESSSARFRSWPPRLHGVLRGIAARLPRELRVPERGRLDLAYAILTDDGEDDSIGRVAPDALLDEVDELRRRLDREEPVWRSREVELRFESIESILHETRQAADAKPDTVTERIDRVLTHKVAGPLFFVLIMGAIFQSVFEWASPAMNLIEWLVTRSGALVGGLLPAGPLRSLVVDGVIAGVGTTLTFVPQIAVLFLFLSIIEDTGYLARAAFIMDRLMARFGLSGRSFIPLLSSFACAIPGIMATRTIDNRRDRLATILIAPFMSCSARLPVYALLIGAFVPRRMIGFITLPGLVLFSMYFLGIAAAVLMAIVLKRTVLAGGRSLHVMELPPYRAPHWRSILTAVRERSWLFVRNAGTVILAVSVVLWFLASHPRGGAPERSLDQRIVAAQQAGDLGLAQSLEKSRPGAVLEGSFAGQVGHFLEPTIRPLGFDWRIGVGLVTSLAAREVMVSTLATMHNLGREGGDLLSLREILRRAVDPVTGRKLYSPLVALSLMVFFVLACQCMSTIAVVRRETNSWRWPLFMLVTMNAMAWLASFVVFQGGRLLGLG
jgi:ferrous iron transport protein B